MEVGDSFLFPPESLTSVSCMSSGDSKVISIAWCSGSSVHKQHCIRLAHPVRDVDRGKGKPARGPGAKQGQTATGRSSS